ncbi:hypothetical protein KXD93_16830 [Mucilaginibacter sp. BJC16-A38]|uniref:hypothetical protein n=1 Tax=Mucilaginibacter phenanthrenivorans TaxID=1234842 RepID=UPI002157E4CB|nr:hypothetical protein [Mucilaginibacter phenanthrenivorans]MCR8559324.1 hypothetical protein [Mucilaginibacter phenanthrenivorans]
MEMHTAGGLGLKSGPGIFLTGCLQGLMHLLALYLMPEKLYAGEFGTTLRCLLGLTAPHHAPIFPQFYKVDFPSCLYLLIAGKNIVLQQ